MLWLSQCSTWYIKKGGAEDSVPDILYREPCENVPLEKQMVCLATSSVKWAQYLLPNHLVPGLNKLRVLRFIKDQFTVGADLCLHSSWETHGFVCGSQTDRHFRSKSRWLASYLQRVISVHHPTVSPGRHNQKRSGAKGQGAGNILKKIPHGRR